MGATVRNRPNSWVFEPYGAQLAMAAAKFSRNKSSDVKTKNKLFKICLNSCIDCFVFLFLLVFLTQIS